MRESTPALWAPPAEAESGRLTDRVLLSTKIAVPPSRPDVVPRSRLIQKLAAGVQRRLTLIAAPAGFGKTTLLCSWIQQAGLRVAWVTLDNGDEDVYRFWSYIVAALDRSHPGLGADAKVLLESRQPPPIDAIVTALLNSLSSHDREIFIVFDDYHLVASQPIHQSVGYFLENLPARAHVAIATRADPPLALARLRSHNQLAEIRAADLRFTPEETAEFLNRVAGLDLTTEEMAALDERTEGWIAGLQLAALSMQGRADVANFIRAFTGSHRYVVDYLMQEVLARQSEHVQSFLLQTCILERLNASLCESVTGQSDSGARLEWLDAANLFIVPLDDERCWYRYHVLFAELLQHRLVRTEPNLLPELHRRAAAWYARAGLDREAINHARAAGDDAETARLIECAIPRLVVRGDIATIRGWIGSLPHDVIRGRARLAVMLAWNQFFDGQLDAAGRTLESIELQLSRGPSPNYLGIAFGGGEATLDPERMSHTLATLEGETATIRSFIALIDGDLVGGLGHARQALAVAPETSAIRGIATFSLGIAQRLNGDVEEATVTIAEANRLNQASGNLFGMFLTSADVAQMHVMSGQLHLAEGIYRGALGFAAGSGGSLPASGLAHFGLGDLYREWNDLEVATGYVQEGINHGQRLTSHGIGIRGQIVLALIEAARGNVGRARSIVTQNIEATASGGFGALHESVLAAVGARLALLAGDVDAAKRWADQSGRKPSDVLCQSEEVIYLSLARVYLADGRLAEARELLARLVQLAERQRRFGSEIEILVVLALAEQAQGDEAGAADSLVRALSLAEPEGYVRIFADEGDPLASALTFVRPQGRPARPAAGFSQEYVDRLLAAIEADRSRAMPVEASDCPNPTVPADPGVAGGLTEREIAILRLIGDGLSNREISERLVIAVSTVKWYVNVIYDKLDVESRTKAVAKARALRIIGG